MAADPSWLGDPNALFLRLGAAAGKCSVDLECGPYLASVIAMIKAPEGEKPRRYVDGHAFAAWLELVNNIMTNLLVPIATTAEFDQQRTTDSLLFVLEMITRGEPDGVAQCEDIAAGKLTLESVLRSRELARLAAKVASAEQQLADAPPVRLDPTVLAALDEASFLRGPDFAVPVHPRAVLAAGSTSSEDGALTATFTVSAASSDLYALYRTWAKRDGWLIEHEEEDDRHQELRVARGGLRVFLLITPWVEGDPSSMVMLRLAGRGAVRFDAGGAQRAAVSQREARLAAGPPPPPPISAPWPLCQPPVRATPESTDALSVIAGCAPAPPQPGDWSPEHVVCGFGYLFIADKDSVYCADPGTGRTERLAGQRIKGPFDWISGLAFDGNDTLFISDRGTKTLSTLALSTNRIAAIATGLDKPTFVACAADAVYVACRDEEIHVIERGTLTSARFATGFGRIRSVVTHGDSLYVLDDESLSRVDRTTGAITRIEVAARNRLTGLASDGASLYATAYATLERVTETGVREVLAGMGKNPRHDPDGLAEDAHVADSTSPACDGSGFVFLTRRRLRRFDLPQRQICTLPIPQPTTTAIDGPILGIGSLGGTRIALGIRQSGLDRKPASVCVIDYMTGARRDIPLEGTNKTLRAFTTDGADTIYFTDDTDAVFRLDTSSHTETLITAISRSEHATALAFGGGRLYATLEESKTLVALDLATNERSTIVTDLQRMKSLAIDVARNALYIGDRQILRVDVATRETTVLTDAQYAGTMDGPRGTARFVGWEHMTVGSDGNLYFSNLYAIRRIRVSDGVVSTVIGGKDKRLVLGGLPGGLEAPTVLCTLPTGELAIVDRENNLVLRARL